MTVLVANNAVSRLAGGLSSAATTLGVMPGDGAKFPAIADGNWFPLTLVKSDGSLEIVKCTARTLDAFTIARAQEGTQAIEFSAGDRVELRLTKAAIGELQQKTADAHSAASTAQSTANAAGTSAATANTAIGTLDGVSVKKTSNTNTGAAILPEGTEADRPTPVPADGLLVRGNKTTGKPEWYNRAKTAWQPFGDASGELFSYAWHNGPRTSIDTGRVPTDGQQLLLLTHPDVCKDIWAGKQNAVDESVWQADPTKRNCWSRGDGTSWVRVPDLNAALAGTGKPFYLRGGPTGLNGTSVGDALKAHGHRIDGASINQGNSTGYHVGIAYSGAGAGDKTGSSLYPINAYRDDFVTTVVGAQTADETRVKTAYGVYTVRVFTEVSNEGAIDAAQLATQLGVVDAKLQTLDANTGFTIIYPNGGTAASPASITAATRYVMPNPFPGHHVICETQILINGVWGSPGFRTDGATGFKAFALASQYGDEIVVRTGQNGVSSAALSSGTPHESISSDALASAPARVLVWKMKGAI